MTASTATGSTGSHGRRRGACPGLSAPMATGDGLLVRLRPRGTIAAAAFEALCAAAHAHGNGIVEVTPRGAVQIRGLSAASAPRFAAAVAALGIAADDGLAILTDPLAGIAPALLDARAYADAVRGALVRSALAARLSPKVSVAIDGGGALGLAAIAADIRLHAVAADRFALSVDGNAVGATGLGLVAAGDAVAAVICLLEMVAAAGPLARMRDVLGADGAARLGARLADLVAGPPPPAAPQGRGDPIGPCPLGDGRFACGTGLPFGHADAARLRRLDRAAQHAGAAGWRTAARALIAVGLPAEAVRGFAGAAHALEFIVRADDPRRRVVACAGAPACGSGLIATRALAPPVAAAAAPLLADRAIIHLSGCAKGCAHAGPAALTVVGTADGCALVADGPAQATPFAAVPAAALPGAIVNALSGRHHD